MYRLQFQRRQAGGAEVLWLAGSIESGSFPPLGNLLSELVRAPRPRIVLECRHLNHVGSMELCELLYYARTARMNGGDIKCVGLKPDIQETAELLADGDSFDCHEHFIDALRAFVRRRKSVLA